MNQSASNSRTAGRVAGTRLPAYMAFAISFAFASAIVLGLLG